MAPEDNHSHATGAAEPSVAELVTRISDQASTLVREEIALAKAEVEVKVKRLGAGAVVGAVAGSFVLFALVFALQALAWGLNDVFDSLWLGFVIVMGLLLVLAALGALFASRAVNAGAPPTPDLAIEEARLIREAIEHPEAAAAGATAAPEVKLEPQPAGKKK